MGHGFGRGPLVWSRTISAGTGDRPDRSRERSLASRGLRHIAGVDEVGRGSWAGPVVAAAVVLPIDLDPELLVGVRDSKLLSPGQREKLAVAIESVASAVGVGRVGPRVLDRIGIVAASRRAMYRALKGLRLRPDHLLVDFLSLRYSNVPCTSLPHGDATCLSIACASIVAKVHRDRLMTRWDERYPGYGFARHKGYGTEEHRHALRRLGPCPIHRRSFAPVTLSQGAGPGGWG